MGRASEKRLAQVRSLVLRTVHEIIYNDVDDPRVRNMTLTDARVSSDLSYADFKVSIPPGMKGDTTECVAALNTASGFIWRRLREETDLRNVPKLRFQEDRTGEFLDEVEEMLQKARAADEKLEKLRQQAGTSGNAPAAEED